MEMVDIKNRPPYFPVSCSFDLFSDAMTCWRERRDGLVALNCFDCIQFNEIHCLGVIKRHEHSERNNVILKKFHELCDEEEEVIDAVGAIKRVTRDIVPVASSTRNESIWYKLFRKPFKKNIKNETKTI